ncbi:MAG: type II toxin-antitoxin system antitoxin SocA domain-containing protein [Polaribacter sp.]
MKKWYQESKDLTDRDFNSFNDFSVLKLIKLQFFVSAINSSKNSILLDNFEFHAMPYGPVETNTYSSIKKEKNLINFELSNFRLNYNNDIKLPEIDENIISEIKEAINILKEKEPRMIEADAGTLVDLSHKWSSWKNNYALARAQNKYSSIIPKEEIINDIKIINIDLVY